MLPAAGVIQPASPPDVGFNIGIFFEERDETRPDRAASALGLIVVPVIIPGDFDIARNAAHQPLGNVEGKRVLHGSARDAGSVEIVEDGHVCVAGAKGTDALIEGVEESLGARHERRRVWKSAEEKQALVKANQLLRVREFEPRKLTEDSIDNRRAPGVEATLNGFETREDFV